jgi:hypothetical protein
MLTESLFADQCERFFNGIGAKRTSQGSPQPYEPIAKPYSEAAWR